MSPQEDFDVDALAAFLHLTPQQVSKMADRGKLPGRRIQGQWRFSRAEVHHWLEDRIGASDESELLEVESVLDRNTSSDAIDLVELLPVAAIAVPLAANSSNSVITAMTNLAADTGLLWDPEKMADAVRARESLHPTALDNGVALLHPRRPLPSILAQPMLALGIAWRGVPFGGSRGVLTDVFFLIASTHDSEHLKMLARLSRLLALDGFVSELRGCESPEDAHALIGRRQAELDS